MGRACLAENRVATFKAEGKRFREGIGGKGLTSKRLGCLKSNPGQGWQVMRQWNDYEVLDCRRRAFCPALLDSFDKISNASGVKLREKKKVGNRRAKPKLQWPVALVGIRALYGLIGYY